MTGSSSGIGKVTVVVFGRKQARVVITFRSNRDGAEKTAELVRNVGGEAFVVQYDITDPESIESTVQAMVDKWRTITVLVNNAAPMEVIPGAETVAKTEGEVTCLVKENRLNRHLRTLEWYKPCYRNRSLSGH